MAVISIPQARSAAMFHVAAQASPAIADIRLAAFSGAGVEFDPTTIEDIDGSPLFYDFTFSKAGKPVGFVRASADTRLSSAIYAIEPNSRRLNETIALQQAQRAIAQIDPEAILLQSSFVCYSFPKIGIKAQFQLRASSDFIIIDYYEGSVIRSRDIGLSSNSDPLTNIDGLLAYSIVENELPEAGPTSIKENPSFANIIKVTSEILPRGGRFGDLEFTESDYVTLADHFADHPPVITTRMLPVPLIPQSTPVFCAVACAQMILSFFGFELTQDQIAAVMAPGGTGVTNSNQIRAYGEISQNRLKPTYDTSPTFAEAEGFLEKLSPMKSGLPGHARVCRGSKRFDFISGLSGEILSTDVWYLINDPYPVGQGSIRWENSANHNYQNFIYLDRVPQS
jgi:hypothetical protein